MGLKFNAEFLFGRSQVSKASHADFLLKIGSRQNGRIDQEHKVRGAHHSRDDNERIKLRRDNYKSDQRG